MKRLLLLIALLMPAAATAAPVITAVSGSTTTGSTITVSGTGLPTKSRSKMLAYADAQQGTLTPNSTLSNNASFNGTENMTTISDSNRRWGNGSFRSNVNYTSTQRQATIRIDFSPSYGSRHYVSWWEKSDIDYMPPSGGGPTHIANLSANWKFGVREWYNISGTRYPNRIFGHVSINQTESSIRFGNESPDYSINGWGADYGFPTTTWRRNTILVQEPSSLGASDGQYHVYRAGTLIRSRTNLQYNNASFPNLPNNIFIQHVIANANWPSGSNWWVSDVAVDDSWGRYEICNASTYAAATQCDVQPFTSVSATSASLTIRKGTQSGSAWLIAFDNNNVASAGFELSGAASAPPPSIDLLTPANGTADGLTLVPLTGQDLVATPSVTVNGVAATGETWVSATEMTFLTPAGTAGTSADVMVINPDLQSDTLTLGWAYDTAVVTGAICPCVVVN